MGFNSGFKGLNTMTQHYLLYSFLRYILYPDDGQ